MHKVTWEDIKVGNGPVVSVGSVVSIYYAVALSKEDLINNIFVENTIENHNPTQVSVIEEELLKGIFIGIQGMRAGGSVRRIHIPSELAFGKRGVMDKVPPNTDLFVEITLRNIIKE